MTPLKAIRKECMYCMGKSSQLVEDCSSSECALYPFRSGKTILGVSRNKAIRAKCLECVGSSDEVKKCTGKMLDGTKCTLHPFRLGTNPNIGPRLLTEDQKEVLRDQLKVIRSKKAA